MDDLTNITKKEANKLVLRQLKNHLTVGFLSSGAAILVTLGLDEDSSRNLIEVLSPIFFVGYSSIQLNAAYGITKQYLSDPVEYMRDRYSKTLIDN